LARAQRGQAEQDRERAKVEAETVIVRAKGEADSQVARAETEAEATSLRGEAEASAIKVKIEAAGGVDGFVRQVQAQSALNGRGQVPQVAAGVGGQIPIVLPFKLDGAK
jgi:regulator of protease activity HflC (stomatin/prohibitin superfamily)